MQVGEKKGRGSVFLCMRETGEKSEGKKKTQPQRLSFLLPHPLTLSCARTRSSSPAKGTQITKKEDRSPSLVGLVTRTLSFFSLSLSLPTLPSLPFSSPSSPPPPSPKTKGSSVDLDRRVDRSHKLQTRPQPYRPREAEDCQRNAGHVPKVEQGRDERGDLEPGEEVEGRVGEDVGGDAAAIEEGAPPPPEVDFED